jgi:cytosine/adenosine deaminase-related metal-dependent hydrolase
MIIGLLLALQLGTPPIYDRVILGGHVMDPASTLDAVRNIGLSGGRIAVITTHAIRGRDTIDARGGGLVVAPGFIDLHAHGQTAETYRFYALDGVTTALELELGTSDVAAWYRERSAGERINYGVSIGHIKVRMAATVPIAQRRRRRLARSQTASRWVSARARSASAQGFRTRRRQRAMSYSPCSVSPQRRRHRSTCTFGPASPV